jgi:hypothetical protein
MSPKQVVTQTLEGLSDAELQQVAEYVQFLRFRMRLRSAPPLDAARIAVLYAEAADEDRAMAEEGMAEYQAGLLAEDAR